MLLEELLVEAKLKAVPKIDKKLPANVLLKIKETGLEGEELFNLKKTVAMQAESGIAERDLLKLVNDYMRLVNSVHRSGKKLI